MALDLNAMLVFSAVVDAGGFTAAARQLGVSKSAVSKQVSALEEQLGSRLLNRTTRRLSPTESGLALYERATRISAEAEAAEMAVNDLAHAPRGLLRLNAPMSFGQKRLGLAIAAFMQAYPDIRIDVTLNDRLVDLVEEGFDLAIRIGSLESSSLIARKLCPVEVKICAAPGYLETAPTINRPADLVTHRCLIYSLRDRPADWKFKSEGGTTQTITVDPVLVANNGDFLQAVAEGGGGVAYLPDFVANDAIADGRLIELFPGTEGQSLAAYAVYPAVRHLAAKVRIFVDFLADWFQDQR